MGLVRRPQNLSAMMTLSTYAPRVHRAPGYVPGSVSPNRMSYAPACAPVFELWSQVATFPTPAHTPEKAFEKNDQIAATTRT